MAETDKTAPILVASEPARPGSVIAPADSSTPPTAVDSTETPLPTAPAAEASELPAQPTVDPAPYALPEDESAAVSSDIAQDEDDEAITWTASEFVAHEKSTAWYVQLSFGAVVLAAVVYFLTKDVISTGIVIFAAFALGVYGARAPRQLQYTLDDEGVKIGQKYYDYEAFRSFAVVPEGVFSSIVFMPLKRFAPLTTIYYDPKDEERILDLLEPRVPYEEYSHDAVERLMRRIRF